MDLIDAIFKLNKPFTYLHTHNVTQQLIDDVINSNRSIEIDIACDESGAPYIGHPLSFYKFKNLPAPHNLELSKALEQLKGTDPFIVIDCKDIRALPIIRNIVNDFHVNNLLLHSWTDALLFKPYPSEIVVEPHWIYEDLPLPALEEFHVTTGLPLILSARGLTHEFIVEHRELVISRLLHLKNIACAINFNLPNFQLPPKDIMELLLDNHILTWINIDRTPANKLPPIYLGASDEVERSSRLSDFIPMRNIHLPPHYVSTSIR